MGLYAGVVDAGRAAASLGRVSVARLEGKAAFKMDQLRSR